MNRRGKSWKSPWLKGAVAAWALLGCGSADQAGGLTVGTLQASGEARLSRPAGIAADALGRVYVSDTLHRRVISLGARGAVTTVFQAVNATVTGGLTGKAQYQSPAGLAVDGAGNVFIADSWNNRVLRVDAQGGVTLAAGDGFTAELSFPTGVALDEAGDLYIADYANNRVRVLPVTGALRTLAGGGASDTTELWGPRSITVDGHGTLYIADSLNHRIRKLDRNGQLTTLAGTGVAGFADGPGASAQFNHPTGVSVDRQGNVFVADSWNNRVRAVDPDGNVTTVAGNGLEGAADGSGGPGGQAELDGPCDLVVLPSGDLDVVDEFNNIVRVIRGWR